MKSRKTDPVIYFMYACIAIAGLYVALHLGYAIDTTKSSQSGMNIAAVSQAFEKDFTNISLILPIKDKIADKSTFTFKITVCAVMAGLLWAAYMFFNRKKYRKGEEHGSARWSTAREAKKLYDDKNAANNIILSEDVHMSLNTRQTRKNLNILAIGGSGAGKTRFFVKPNIMQMNTSYVITDPKGELLRSTGKMLERNGYRVKVFNLINMKNSFNYNPLAYLKDANGNYSDTNVMKLINTFMKNTKAEGFNGGDQFWEDATKSLLMALVYFVVYEGNEDEKNFATIVELLKMAQVKEEDEDFKSPLDFMFETLEEENKNHMAVKYYKDYKQAAGKTAKTILISCSVRLAAFNIQDVIDLTHTDTLDIDDMGEQKTALFVVIPDSDDTFNFLVAMLYTQIFDVLYNIADFKHGGRLPVHVRFLLDEFANIGTIPRFDKLVATMRSREISVNVIIQNMAQLKTIYKESWESIVGNCDSLLFLGGKEQTSLEYISKALGKETLDTMNRNVSKSYKSNSTSHNEGIVGRELMTPNEVGEMPDKDCIVLIRGLHPFYSQKFKVEKHRNYSSLEDANPANAYAISGLQTMVMTRVMAPGQADGSEYEEVMDDFDDGEEDLMISEDEIEEFDQEAGEIFSEINFEELMLDVMPEYVFSAEQEELVTIKNNEGE